MKKKMFSGLFALALLATAGYGVQKSMSNNADLNDLAMANVEALAQSETITIDCDQWYNETCAEIIINGTKTVIPGRKR